MTANYVIDYSYFGMVRYTMCSPLWRIFSHFPVTVGIVIERPQEILMRIANRPVPSEWRTIPRAYLACQRTRPHP